MSVHRQFMTSAAGPDGSPGNLQPFENVPLTGTLSPSMALWLGLVLPSSVASHICSSSIPMDCARW